MWKREPPERPRDISKCITARVAVRGRVGSSADADAVEDDDDCAFQVAIPV